jgi:hypothetical protein
LSTNEPPVLSLADTLMLLREPFALEDIAGAPVPMLVTAVPADAILPPEDLEDLTHLLASIRAVSVAVATDVPTRTAAEILDAFDIVVGAPDTGGTGIVETRDIDATLSMLAASVTAHPSSSVALIQLLRLRAFTRVPDGLVLESLTYSTLQAGPAFKAWLDRRGPAEVPADTEPPVLSERAGTSLRITLNRPHRANAFTAQLRDALVEALRLAAFDNEIEGVLLGAVGESFSSGGDLAEFGSTPDPATAHATRLQRSPAWWMDRLSRDVRVELHGQCVGAGIEVPAFAGTVLAAPNTRIRLPEVAMGLVPGAGGTVSIARRIGRQRTAWLAITGLEIGAEEALRWGLIDRIVR